MKNNQRIFFFFFFTKEEPIPQNSNKIDIKETKKKKREEVVRWEDITNYQSQVDERIQNGSRSRLQSGNGKEEWPRSAFSPHWPNLFSAASSSLHEKTKQIQNKKRYEKKVQFFI